MQKVAVVIPFDYEKYFSRSQIETDVNKLLTTHSSFHIQWAKAFRSSEFDTKIFYISSSDKKVEERNHKSGIKMISCPILFNFKSHKNHISLKMINSIKEFNPDLIFIMDLSWLQSYILSLYFHNRDIPIINRNAGSDILGDLWTDTNAYRSKYESLKFNFNIMFFIKYLFYKYKLLNLPLKRYINQIRIVDLFKKSSLIMVESKKDMYVLTNKLSINSNKVKFLSKPVDTDLFYSKDKDFCKNKLDLELEYDYLLHISNLYDTKGCENIISVLPNLIKTNSNLKLIVIGEGPQKIILETLAKNLNIEENIIFKGRIPHELLPLYYNASEAVILLSNRVKGEGRPNVLLEAISCSKPIISSNLGVIKNLVEPNFGYCIKYDDGDNLVICIKKILSGEFSLDKNEVSNFRNNYSLKNTATSVLNLIYNR